MQQSIVLPLNMLHICGLSMQYVFEHIGDAWHVGRDSVYSSATQLPPSAPPPINITPSQTSGLCETSTVLGFMGGISVADAVSAIANGTSATNRISK